ncbi:MAG: undecaprenyl-diphosphate phosphatase [Rhodothermales bacterium]|nr:undecaprenyl-diphosphate phosphatase [Rhodothermales bacterium]
MQIWQALLLGLIQGLTEFLPVSSSGHLVLSQYLLGLDASVAEGTLFEVCVHFGTVMSIVTVYGRRIGKLVAAGVQLLIKPHRIRSLYQDDVNAKTVLLIALTMVPTGLAYIFFGDYLEAKFSDPRFTSGMLLVTGALLLLTMIRKNPSGDLNLPKAFLVGVSQALALFPGISRSGSTICTALYVNVDPQKAADFSFLMLLPVVLGATALKLFNAVSAPAEIEWSALLAGTLVAYISGVAAIKILLEVIRRGKLQYFAIYCFAIGIAGLLLID